MQNNPLENEATVEIHGTENLKKAIKFASDFTKQSFTAMQDGKFTWTDSLQFLDEALQLPDLAKSLPAAKNEIADLSATEREELVNYFAIVFDIPNDQVERLIEKSIVFTLGAVDLVGEWRDIKGGK